MRTIAFLLLFAMTVCAQANTLISVSPNASVTPERLGRAMSASAACSAVSGTPAFDPLPQTMFAEVAIAKGAILRVAALTSSGNPAFDQKSVQCLQNLPQDFTMKIGDALMFVPVHASDGAIVPDPSTTFVPPLTATPNGIAVQLRPALQVTTPSAPGAALRAGPAPPSWPPGSCGAYYPPVAIRLRQEGDVELVFTIATDGAVKDISLVKSSGQDALDQAAMRCIATWQYKPATRNGVPVQIQWRAIVRFKLGDSTAAPPNILALQLASYNVQNAAYRCIGSSPPSEDDLKAATGKTVVFIALNRGAISDVKIYQTSGSDKLDNAAVRCFRSVQTGDVDTKALAQVQGLQTTIDWVTAGTDIRSAAGDAH